MNRVVLAELTTEPLDVAVHEAAVADPRAGAVVSFAGVVRDHDHGRSVDALTYESHPSAAEVLQCSRMMRRLGNLACRDLKVGRNAGSALRMVMAPPLEEETWVYLPPRAVGVQRVIRKLLEVVLE